ncbi:regulatory protein [Escherichia coli]|nr:regulatory protein [Escherichia coli]
MSKQVTLMTDAIPYQEFAKLIGKSTGAVRRMIDKGKLPVIDMTDPQSASGRAGEYWVYLPAWNTCCPSCGLSVSHALCFLSVSL